MFLTPEEVIELTHKKKRSAQICALRGMGIEHRIRPDGTIAIMRSHIEKILGGLASKNDRINHQKQPNWSAFNAQKTQ